MTNPACWRWPRRRRGRPPRAGRRPLPASAPVPAAPIMQVTAHNPEDLLGETASSPPGVAWRGFEGRASIRASLYRIQTERAAGLHPGDPDRRPEAAQRGTPEARAHPLRRGDLAGALPRRPARGDPGATGYQAAGAAAETKEAIELGFIIDLQRLFPPHRAVLVLPRHAARLPRRRGPRDPTHHRTPRSTACRARPARRSMRGLPAAERERAPLPRLRTQARRSRPLRQRDPNRRHRMASSPYSPTRRG